MPSFDGFQFVQRELRKKNSTYVLLETLLDLILKKYYFKGIKNSKE